MDEGALMFLFALLFQSPTISFDFEVGPIASAVRQLSEAAHVPLSIRGAAANETVFLHVDRRPLTEVLAELAKVTRTEWTNENGTLVLVRPAHLTEETKAEEACQRLSILNKWRREALGKLEVSASEKYATYRAVQTHEGRSAEEAFRLPLIETLLTRCIADLDLTRVAQLEKGERVVYSLHPTPAQHPLPQTARDALVRFNATLHAWQREAAQEQTKKPTKPGLPEEKIYRPYLYMTRNPDLCKSGSADAVCLALYRDDDRFAFDFYLLDKSKRVIGSSSDSIADHRAESAEPSRIPVICKPATPAARPATRAFWEAVRTYDPPMAPREIDRLLAPYFDDPVHYDLLNLGNQEALQAVGSVTGKSVVACIPDEGVSNYPNFDLDRYLKLGTRFETTTRLNGEWIEYSPASFVDHWGSRCDRQAIARFAREFRTNGVASAPTVAATLPRVQKDLAFFWQNLQIINPPGRNGHQSAWHLMTLSPGFTTLFQTLSLTQWSDLKRGFRIPYSQLTAEQLQACAKVILAVPTTAFSSPRNVIGLARWEPTEELANGLNDGGGLSGEEGSYDICVAHDPTEPPERDLVEMVNVTPTENLENAASSPCGIRARCKRFMRFEMRKWHYLFLKCFLKGNHYYLGAFYPPIQPDTGKRLRYEELPKRVQFALRKDNPGFDRPRPVRR